MWKLAWVAALLAACGPREAPRQPSPGNGSGSVVAQPAPPDAPAVSEPGMERSGRTPASADERLAAIQKAMNELDEGAQGCWAAAATERFDIQGEIVMQVDITSTGAIAMAVRDTVKNARLASCMTGMFGVYQWPPPLHGETIQLPFRFRAPAGQNVIDRRLVERRGQGKAAVGVLLDESNSDNDAASMFELALQAGGSTGMRVAGRAELWYFHAPATVNGQPVAAGDMAYVPAQAAREIAAGTTDVAAMIVVVPGGREGSARAGALPTRERLATDKALGKPVILRAAAAKVYPRPQGRVTIFAEPATTKQQQLAASVLELPAGATVPEHAHAQETELLYVLAGAGTMTVNGVPLAVTATSVIQIPPRTKHAFTATADVRAVQLYTPAGPEQRFKAK